MIKKKREKRKTKLLGVCGGILFTTCWFVAEALCILRFISPPMLFSTHDLRVWKKGVPQCEPVLHTFPVEVYMFSTVFVAIPSITQ